MTHSIVTHDQRKTTRASHDSREPACVGVPTRRSLVPALALLFLVMAGGSLAHSAEPSSDPAAERPRSGDGVERVESLAEKLKGRIEAERHDLAELLDGLDAASTPEQAERLVFEIECRKLQTRIEILGIQSEEAQLAGHVEAVTTIQERIAKLQARRSRLSRRSAPSPAGVELPSTHE